MANYIFEAHQLMDRLERLRPALESYSEGIAKHNQELEAEQNRRARNIEKSFMPNHSVDTLKAKELQKKLNRKKWFWEEKVDIQTALDMVRHEREKKLSYALMDLKSEISSRKIYGDKYYNRFQYLVSVCERAGEFDLIQLNDAECETIDALDKFKLT